MSLKQKNTSSSRFTAPHHQGSAANVRSLRILEVVPYFYPAWAYGGPAKLVYDISRYLSSQGNQVRVFTSDSFDSNNRMPQSKRLRNIPNLKVFYFRNLINSLAYRINAFVTPGMFIPAIPSVLWADIVHLHDFYTPEHMWIGFLCRILNKPFILSVHGCLEPKRMKARSLIKRAILAVYGRQLLLTASKLIATSDNEVEAYLSHGVRKSNIVRMGHGISMDEFDAGITKAQARKKLRLPEDKVIVTFLGRIHAIKGLDLLVGAAGKLKDSGLHFVIAGSDDGYLDRLIADIRERKLTKNITRMGTCFGKQKAELFKASDMFVYPSYSEGFSLGILEAAASGLPLIITQGCHFPQVGKVGAGIVVPPDSEKLATAIIKMAGNKSLRDASAKKARDLIASNYSMDHIGEQLFKTYLDAL